MRSERPIHHGGLLGLVLDPLGAVKNGVEVPTRYRVSRVEVTDGERTPNVLEDGVERVGSRGREEG